MRKFDTFFTSRPKFQCQCGKVSDLWPLVDFAALIGPWRPCSAAGGCAASQCRWRTSARMAASWPGPRCRAATLSTWWSSAGGQRLTHRPRGHRLLPDTQPAARLLSEKLTELKTLRQIQVLMGILNISGFDSRFSVFSAEGSVPLRTFVVWWEDFLFLGDASSLPPEQIIQISVSAD